MPEEMIELTKRALHRLKVVEAVTDRRLTQAAAGGQLGLTTRQVKRLVAAYRAQGAAGLVSLRIGEPSTDGSRSRYARRSAPCWWIVTRTLG